MGKREHKQFNIDSKESCCIYLVRIIVTAEKCLMKLKTYNKQTKDILDEYDSQNADCIPYDLYGECVDKASNVIDYLLNILGDAQSSSISYFKYRMLAKKLVERNVDGVSIIEFDNELDELIKNFNKLRNWENHIPESLLISEEKLVEDGLLRKGSENPIEIYFYNSVTVELFKNLYNSNINFYDEARKLIQAAKRDYGCLIGESVRIQRVYLDKSKGIELLEAAKMSAEIQGIRGD